MRIEIVLVAGCVTVTQLLREKRMSMTVHIGRRRATALGAALVITLPLLLSGCGSKSTAAPAGAAAGSGGATAGQATVHVLDYYNEGNDNKVIGAALTACGKANNLTIDRNAVPGAGLIQKVLQQSSSKTLPDVLMLDNPDLQQIAKSGALTPLSDYDIPTAGYAPGILQAGTYKDKIYGLAPTVNSIALFYNKDVLAKAGITPPATWEELRADAKKLTAGSQYGWRWTPTPPTRAAGLSCPSCGPTAAPRRTSTRRRWPRRCSSGSTW